jgi:hypothetical protein
LHKLLAGTDPEGTPSFVNHLEAPGAWTYFEELSTVDELKRETGTNDLSQIVSSVLTPKDQESQSLDAKRLISFLTAVEGRALQRYADSTEMQFI